MRPGPRNLITDIEGLLVGNAEDHTIKTGTTVLTAEVPFTAAVHVMGGAPGTRESDLLSPENTVDQVTALVLSGGSAFGLDAASGVVDALKIQKKGFEVLGHHIPIVPAAILFDLANGGDKSWDMSPYPDLGRDALADASPEFGLGSVGAGCGATTATLKGGLGSTSAILENGFTVGALVAVNAVGEVTVNNSRHFWAAPFEENGEFGGSGPAPASSPPKLHLKGLAQNSATTIGIVATDAKLTKSQAKRMAIAAHDGFARAIVPSHSPMDGDLIYAVSKGTRELTDPVLDPLRIGHAAATCMARAIARGVYEAEPATGDSLPSYREKF